jgi:DNA-binding GntR family transcriptional regulator
MQLDTTDQFGNSPTVQEGRKLDTVLPAQERVPSIQPGHLPGDPTQQAAVSARLATASVVELLMERIRDAIMTRKLVPGERYSAEEVNRLLQLGVSRTPVREAMARLANVGIVRLERNRGIRIVKATARDLEELFQLRLMVEVPATYRAVLHNIDPMLVYRLESELAAMGQAVKASERIARGPNSVDHAAQFESINIDFLRHDIAFHELIIAASGNRRLVSSVHGWRDVITAQRGWRLAETRDLAKLYEEHKCISDAVEACNPEGAASAMYSHIVVTGTSVLKELRGADPDDTDGFDDDWYEGVAVAVPGSGTTTSRSSSS